MPQTEVVFYKESNEIFFLDWLKTIALKAQRKCLVYLSQLEANGHDLRRPVADLLRDGVYELRPSVNGIHYRILYFFSGREIVVISHGIIKESAIPDIEIQRAIDRKRKYAADPDAHAFRG